MEKLYKVVITAIDTATKEETVEVEETFTGLTLVADCDDERMAEIVLHDNISNMAAKLAAGRNTRVAVKLAAIMAEEDRASKADIENALMRAIMGGIENE